MQIPGQSLEILDSEGGRKCVAGDGWSRGCVLEARDGVEVFHVWRTVRSIAATLGTLSKKLGFSSVGAVFVEGGMRPGS